MADPRLAQLKAQKQALQLELKAVNNEMAAIRANYSQKLPTMIFKKYGRAQKDQRLHKLEPKKEQLQAQILAISQEIARLQAG